MPTSRSQSAAAQSPKPVNIFYIWYVELCRRSNVQPLASVKPAKPKSESVLDFVSDRIKAEEWPPIINALRTDTSLHVIAVRSRIDCKFLFEVDNEEKVRSMKRKFGTLYTSYFFNHLIASLMCCITRTTVLACLELDGLPVTSEHLQLLLEALRKNKTVRILSLQHCAIRDSGCQQLCLFLRYMPNVEILNLTSCGLGVTSAEALAKVIRCQQINRYCESWHNSLRYEDPEVGSMAGLKRITLNNNPQIGNEGLELLLNELDDDLWIKAIDMQRCNITESIGSRLVDVVDYSRSLEIADFRNNDQLSSATVEKIFNILKSKNRFGYECEYQWCLSSTTIPCETSTYDLVSPSYVTSNIQKSKSAPFKSDSKVSPSEFRLRRTKTFAIMNKKPAEKAKPVNQKDVNLARKQVMELNAQLQSEITKRMETEKQNKELKDKLKLVRNTCSKQTIPESKLIKDPKTKSVLDIKIPNVNNEIVQSALQQKPQLNIKPVENEVVVSKKPVEFVFPSNGSRLAQNLFENFVSKSAVTIEEDEEEDLLALYCENRLEKSFDSPSKMLGKIEEDDFENASNASLIRYVREMTGDANHKPETVAGVAKETSCFKKEMKRRKPPMSKFLAKVPPVR